jgi:hypothetical protein
MSRNRQGLISFPNTKVLCLVPLRREVTFGLQLGISQLAPFISVALARILRRFGAWLPASRADVSGGGWQRGGLGV